MKFMLGKHAMTSFTHTLANLPARQSLLDSGAYDDLPQFGAWLQSLKSKNVHVLSSVPVAQQYTTDLVSALDSIVRTTKSPGAALSAVAAKAKAGG
jgi:multiple sugar transport system substrate-binding protein